MDVSDIEAQLASLQAKIEEIGTRLDGAIADNAYVSAIPVFQSRMLLRETLTAMMQTREITLRTLAMMATSPDQVQVANSDLRASSEFEGYMRAAENELAQAFTSARRGL